MALWDDLCRGTIDGVSQLKGISAYDAASLQSLNLFFELKQETMPEKKA